MKTRYIYFRIIKKLLGKSKVKHTVFGHEIQDIENGGNTIRKLLEQDAPCMIARIGSTEMQSINAVYTNDTGLRKDVPQVYLDGIYTYSGFFPKNEKALRELVSCYEEAAKHLDCAAVLQNRDEDFFYKTFAPHNITYVDLCALEPYYSENPWSVALKKKKVLVISPFEDTIRQQFNKREHLFENPDILPPFELVTIKAVQSLGNNTGGFASWFEALESMKNQMEQIDFDIALIGCGAYSFPLAAYAKTLGKKSVVVGGALQLIFGIKGRRWDDSVVINKLCNEYWTRPGETECPKGAENVESGCYW